MKKLILLMSIFMGIFSAVSADEYSTFEVLNKSREPIWIKIVNKDPWNIDRKIFPVFAEKVDKDTYNDATIDIQKQTMLGIWLQDPARISTNNEPQSTMYLGVEYFDPQPNYLFTFSQGFPIFVTFNPDNDNEIRVLYPQTGPLYGIKGVTKSGKPLKYNMQERDIVQLK